VGEGEDEGEGEDDVVGDVVGRNRAERRASDGEGGGSSRRAGLAKGKRHGGGGLGGGGGLFPALPSGGRHARGQGNGAFALHGLRGLHGGLHADRGKQKKGRKRPSSPTLCAPEREFRGCFVCQFSLSSTGAASNKESSLFRALAAASNGQLSSASLQSLSPFKEGVLGRLLWGRL